MSDLISRSALLAEYDRVHIGPAGGARKLMENAPAVDAVEVVRCKDCKFCVANDCKEACDEDFMCSAFWMGIKEDKFCAWAKRRDEECEKN